MKYNKSSLNEKTAYDKNSKGNIKTHNQNNPTKSMLDNIIDRIEKLPEINLSGIVSQIEKELSLIESNQQELATKNLYSEIINYYKELKSYIEKCEEPRAPNRYAVLQYLKNLK